MEKENVIAAIELVIREFIASDAIGKWFSVKERSLGNVIKDVGLNNHYSASIYEELRKHGLVETEGERSGLRYKILTDSIPDVKSLSEKVFLNYKNRVSSMTSTPTNPRDFKPLKRHPHIGIDEYFEGGKKSNSKVKRELNRIPRLGEIVYVVVRGQITEAKVICIRFGDNDKVIVDFITPIFVDENGNNVQLSKKNWCLKDIFFSVDEALLRLKNSVKKFDKK